jgi:hypothetical protein
MQKKDWMTLQLKELLFFFQEYVQGENFQTTCHLLILDVHG